jgi:hypothetical protein
MEFSVLSYSENSFSAGIYVAGISRWIQLSILYPHIYSVVCCFYIESSGGDSIEKINLIVAAMYYIVSESRSLIIFWPAADSNMSLPY